MKILVKLSRPLLINIGTDGNEPKYSIVYGFVSRYWNETEDKEQILKNIDSYVLYLSAMYYQEFAIDENKDWIDVDGRVHIVSANHNDSWVKSLCVDAKERIGLTYTLYRVNMSMIQEISIKSDLVGSTVTSKTLMDELLDIAEPLDKLNSVYLFNRPIFLHRRLLRMGEEGFVHIYGVAVENEPNEQELAHVETYLGFLAMCEDVDTLNGVTPTGFTARLNDNGAIWYKCGKEYYVPNKEILAEAGLCRSKHGLAVCLSIAGTPWYDLVDGVIDDLIISKEVYENLLFQHGE